MRRTAAPPDPSTESFSGLLERLAQRVSATGTPHGAEQEQTASPPAARRQPAPIPQLKSSRAKSTEAVPLSYESALRAHSRYRPTASQFPIPTPAATTAAGAAATTPGTTAFAPQAKAPNSASAPSASRALQPAQPRHSAPTPRPVPGEGTKRSVTAGDQPSPRSLSRSTQKPARTPATRAGRSTAEKIQKPSPTSTSTSRRSSHPAKNPAQRATAAVSNSKVASIVSRPLRQNPLALELKQTTISVRLSSQDSDRLRLRAAESGLTVSAYMRSCVLDAEHLRDQVKQALAELRARTNHPEPALLPANTPRSNLLLRLLAKPAAFFFGPWLPLRRSA